MDKKEIDWSGVALASIVLAISLFLAGLALCGLAAVWSDTSVHIAENNAKIRQLEVADKATRE